MRIGVWVLRLAVFVILWLVAILLALLLLRYGFRFHITDGWSSIPGLSEFINNDVLSDFTPKASAWVRGATILPSAVRETLVDLLQIKMVVVTVPHIYFKDAVVNVIGFFTLGFVWPIVPLFLAILVVVGVIGGLVRGDVAMIIGGLFAGVFGAVACGLLIFGVIILWVQLFFHSSEPLALLTWIVCGLPALIFGLSTSLFMVISPFTGASSPRLPGKLGAIVRLPYTIIAWLHYFFVPHPAEAIIKEATRPGDPQPINTSQFAATMKRKLSLDPDDHPAGYKSENQTKKAEALAALMEADRKLMEAVKEREKARHTAHRMTGNE